MQKLHAVGIVISDRWELTNKTLQSLYHTDQLASTYDLFLIDNGSDNKTSSLIMEWLERGLVPVKNLVRISKRLSIGPAWNLFLELSKNYAYRTKLDNDIIFANTPITPISMLDSAELRQRASHNSPGPGDFGTNPGAIPNASIQMGAGKKVKAPTPVRNTRFLDLMQDSLEKLKIGISGLVPVPMGRTMDDFMRTLAYKKWRNEPYLIGSCMLIPKECFDKIGYFQDRLSRFIDREYSQRAMAVGINAGYVQDYCTIDIGGSSHTLSDEKRQSSEWESNNLMDNIGFSKDFCTSKWSSVGDKIRKSALNNQVVTLNLK